MFRTPCFILVFTWSKGAIFILGIDRWESFYDRDFLVKLKHVNALIVKRYFYTDVICLDNPLLFCLIMYDIIGHWSLLERSKLNIYGNQFSFFLVKCYLEVVQLYFTYLYIFFYLLKNPIWVSYWVLLNRGMFLRTGCRFAVNIIKGLFIV